MKTNRYEAADGKRYVSTYNIPQKTEYKEVQIVTGETAFTTSEVYTQELDDLSLEAIIKAANNLE